jgi:hypothetical protein
MFGMAGRREGARTPQIVPELVCISPVPVRSATSALASWSAFSVRPLASFQAVRPLALPPTTTAAAADGEEKRKS